MEAALLRIGDAAAGEDELGGVVDTVRASLSPMPATTSVVVGLQLVNSLKFHEGTSLSAQQATGLANVILLLEQTSWLQKASADDIEIARQLHDRFAAIIVSFISCHETSQPCDDAGVLLTLMSQLARLPDPSVAAMLLCCRTAATPGVADLHTMQCCLVAFSYVAISIGGGVGIESLCKCSEAAWAVERCMLLRQQADTAEFPALQQSLQLLVRTASDPNLFAWAFTMVPRTDRRPAAAVLLVHFLQKDWSHHHWNHLADSIFHRMEWRCNMLLPRVGRHWLRRITAKLAEFMGPATTARGGDAAEGTWSQQSAESAATPVPSDSLTNRMAYQSQSLLRSMSVVTQTPQAMRRAGSTAPSTPAHSPATTATPSKDDSPYKRQSKITDHGLQTGGPRFSRVSQKGLAGLRHREILGHLISVLRPHTSRNDKPIPQPTREFFAVDICGGDRQKLSNTWLCRLECYKVFPPEQIRGAMRSLCHLLDLPPFQHTVSYKRQKVFTSPHAATQGVVTAASAPTTPCTKVQAAAQRDQLTPPATTGPAPAPAPAPPLAGPTSSMKPVSTKVPRLLSAQPKAIPLTSQTLPVPASPAALQPSHVPHGRPPPRPTRRPNPTTAHRPAKPACAAAATAAPPNPYTSAAQSSTAALIAATSRPSQPKTSAAPLNPPVTVKPERPRDSGGRLMPVCVEVADSPISISSSSDDLAVVRNEPLHAAAAKPSREALVDLAIHSDGEDVFEPALAVSPPARSTATAARPAAAAAAALSTPTSTASSVGSGQGTKRKRQSMITDFIDLTKD